MTPSTKNPGRRPAKIRDSLYRVLDKNTTLAERIRILFREQGVTIASILTAIGLAISTLVLALTGGGAGVPAAPVTPTPPPLADKGGLKEWTKKHLQALGRMLAQLAGKAAAALPGLIGGVVSWLLNLVSKTVRLVRRKPVGTRGRHWWPITRICARVAIVL